MDNRKNEIRAFLLTLLVVLITVLLLLFTGMHYEYPPRDMDLVQLKQDSIMFGGEYVMLGNTPQPTESEEMDTENPETAEEVAEQPSVEGDDLEDAGEPAKQAKPLVTAKEPSPMKVKEKPKEEKPKKTGPATTQNEASKQEKVKKGNDAATNNRVKNSFGKSQGRHGRAERQAGHRRTRGIHPRVLGTAPQPLHRLGEGAGACQRARTGHRSNGHQRLRRGMVTRRSATQLRERVAKERILCAQEHHHRGRGNHHLAIRVTPHQETEFL